MTGPTAVGKTSVGIKLATEIGAEIISIDSRQIYRELNIGTAKPSADELAAVSHHLISERSIANPVTAAEYADMVHTRCDDARSRGTRVLLVGGSTLYLDAIVHGLDDVPPTDPGVRQDLQKQLEISGLNTLYNKLVDVDASYAASVDSGNPRRILRALEVFETTGLPYSTFLSKERAPSSSKYRVFVLDRPRPQLYARINRRVDLMLASGLVDEVRALLDSGFDSSSAPLQTIGYRETFQYLDGQIDMDRLTELIKRNTRRYAKRQLTWFRRHAEYEWADIGSGDASAVDAILSHTG